MGRERVVSRQKMGYGATLFHWMMIFCTCGLWTPVFMSAKRKRKTVTRYRPAS